MRSADLVQPRARRTWSAIALLVAIASAAFSIAGSGHATAPEATTEADRHRAAILDDLFAKLKAARSQDEADAVIARIWEAWARSGRDDVDVLISRAVANMAGRHFGLARLLLDEIIELAPNFAEAWNKRATLFYNMGQYQAALDDIATALRLESRHFGALAGRAAIYADTNRWKEALESYRAALAINPFLTSRAKVLPELERRAGERGL
jgi:tetratricopeptide (TPR) repeat protein